MTDGRPQGWIPCRRVGRVADAARSQPHSTSPASGGSTSISSTAGHITSEEGRALMEALQERLGRPEIEFFPGVSYRNLMDLSGGWVGPSPFADDTLTTPPHDQPDQPAADYLPRGTGLGIAPRADRSSVPRSSRDHPVNRDRLGRVAKPPANAIWLWGQGKAPRLPRFQVLHGLKGAIISAVHLVRGSRNSGRLGPDPRPPRNRLPRHRLCRQGPLRRRGA